RIRDSFACNCPRRDRDHNSNRRRFAACSSVAAVEITRRGGTVALIKYGTIAGKLTSLRQGISCASQWSRNDRSKPVSRHALPDARWPLLENELYRLFSPNNLLLHQCSKGSAD